MIKETIRRALEDAIGVCRTVERDQPPAAKEAVALANLSARWLADASPPDRVRHYSETELLGWLRGLLGNLIGASPAGALLSRVWLIPNPLFGAKLVASGDDYAILLNQGLLPVLCNRICVLLLRNRLELLLSRGGLAEKEQNDVTLGLTHLFRFSEATTILSVKEVVPLPYFEPYLTPYENELLRNFLLAAESFLLLHENAHHVLGHYQPGRIDEAHKDHFWISENTSKYKQMELDADAHAIDSVHKAHRAIVALGASLLIDIAVCHEIWSGRVSTAHPLALNRVHAILSRDDVKEGVQEALASLSSVRNIYEHSQANFVPQGPPEQRLEHLLMGYNIIYACDYAEWLSSYTLEMLRH